MEMYPKKRTVLEEDEIIPKILQNLDGDELKEARLVCSNFNRIIMTHPDLFWKKNLMPVRIKTPEKMHKSKEDALDLLKVTKEWLLLKLNELVSHYGCPNFHFKETNLMSLGSANFFGSSVRHTIKHLQLTKCTMTTDYIIHVLDCCASTMKHFEVRDFSGVTKALEPILFPEEKEAPSLPNLEILILDNSSNGSEKMNDVMTEPVLHHLLDGTSKLKHVTFTGWDAKSCKCFFQIFSSLSQHCRKEIRKLELLCFIDENSSTLTEYSFLKCLGYLNMPKLRSLSLRFDRPINPFLPKRYLDELTESVASVIEFASTNIENVELINCPVTNEVFRRGASFYPKLRRVTTKGCLIKNLDGDGINEFNLKSMSSFSSDDKKWDSLSEGTTTEMPEQRGSEEMQLPDTSSEELQTNAQLEETGDFEAMCLIIGSVVLLGHMALDSVFPRDIANCISISLIFLSLIVYVFMKRKKIGETWRELTNRKQKGKKET